MEFWKEVRRQVLTNELSQRAALKKYGLGWHTLKKILAHAEPPGYCASQPQGARTSRELSMLERSTFASMSSTK
jgi:transposase